MDYLLTFLEGFASFISPCVLPLLPLYISYFAGGNTDKKHKALINSIAFVLGFTIVFTALAVVVNSLGARIINVTRIIKIVFGILVIILGIRIYGTIWDKDFF